MEDLKTNNNISAGGSRSVGPIIGLVIIIAVIFLGGIYFWTTREKTSEYSQKSAPENADETAAIINSVPTSSEDSSSIEAALEATVIEDDI